MSWEEQICTYLQANIDGLRTCQRYAGEFDSNSVNNVSFTAPAVFVSCLGWVKAKEQPGDGRTAYTVRFAAFLVAEKPTLQNPDHDIVALSLAITHAIDDKVMGLSNARAAKVQKAENGINTELDQQGLGIWAVTWLQDIYLGESPWNDGEVVDIDVRYSYEPLTGEANKDKYQSTDPEAGNV